MARYSKFKYGGYFTDDFSGALGPGWDGATWSTAGGRAINAATGFASQSCTRNTQVEIETSAKIWNAVPTNVVGLVTHLDSVDNPLNFILAYHQGLGWNCELVKYVAGADITLISEAPAYVAGAIIQVKAYLSGADLMVSLFYNGVQVGVEQTVSDVSIVSNVRHGMWSSNGVNTLDDYDLRGYGVTARGTMYGVSVSKALRWAIEVDWDGDGAFTGENEADHCVGYNLRRGREFFMKSDGSGFEPVRVGTVALTLLNEDRRYDPYYAAGDLYGLLDRNQRIRIRVMDEATGIIYPRFDGYIDDIRPNYGTPSTVTLIASDGLKVLTNKKIRSSGVYTTIRYNIALAQCLTDAGWAGASSIDSIVSDTMPYWWTSGNSALSEMQDLTDAVLGRLFAAADGTITYKSRLSSDTPIYTMLDADVLESYKIRVPTPRETIRNLIRVYARARTIHAAVELWRAVDQPSIPTGGSITVWANFSYNGEDVPATVVTDPVNGVDYTCSAGGIITHVMTTFAASAKIVFTNAGVPATMTLMKLRGTCITTDEYTFAEDSDAASIAIYGEREFVIDTNWLQDINSAIDQVAALKVILSTPRQYPRVLLRHNVAKQFGVDLFDIISVNFVSMGYTDDLRVGYIEESWTIPTGDVVDTIIGFEPNMAGSTTGSWIFTVIFGLTTVFA